MDDNSLLGLNCRKCTYLEVSTVATSRRQRTQQVQQCIPSIPSLLHSLRNEVFLKQTDKNAYQTYPTGTHKPIQQSTVNKCSSDHEHTCHQKTKQTLCLFIVKNPAPLTRVPLLSGPTAAVSPARCAHQQWL